MFVLVVSTRNEIRFVTTREILHTINSFIMAFQGKIRSRRPKTPNLKGNQYSVTYYSLQLFTYFHRPVERGTRKGVGIFWIEDNSHYVMGVPLKDLDVLPAFFPIPELNEHVVGGR
jgi:hypothetical protein